MQLKFQPSRYGRYILLNKVAVGGMAEVFRAKAFGAEGFEKLIAIKRLYPHLCEDESFVQMFINEAKLAATLNHVNIAPIHDFGRRDGLYYIGMEYVRGCDLADLIERCRQRKQHVPLGLAVWLLIEICNGLDYAHRKHDDLGNFLNLIHRDITPQNILLSYEGEVKITDFGIAKVQVLGRDETTGGVLKGKFSYMSPEQVRGERMDHRSDIFSLGIVAWELLTCQKMFDGPNDYHILEKVREALFIPPSQINHNLPPELEKIIMRALTRHPQDRYPSVGELRLDLLRFLSGSQLFPSRAHLSAFIRKLFKERLEQESHQIIEETNIARAISVNEPEIRSQVENSLFPSSGQSSPAPASFAPSIEVLAGGLPPASASTPFAQSTKTRSLSTSEGSPTNNILQPGALQPAALRPVPTHMPSPSAPFGPDDEDEPTLPDIAAAELQQQYDVKPSLEVIQRPMMTSSQPGFAPPPQRPVIRPEAQAHFEELDDDDDELYTSGFSMRRNLTLVVGLGTFIIGVVLVLVFSWVFTKQVAPLEQADAGFASTPLPPLDNAGGAQDKPEDAQLLITSTPPDAYIYINGRFASYSPYKGKLTPGTYKVQVKFLSLRKQKRLKIILRPGQTITRSVRAKP